MSKILAGILVVLTVIGCVTYQAGRTSALINHLEWR